MKMTKKYLVFIAIIFVFGLVIRNLYISNLLFGFEQGRDFFVAKDIASLHKLTLLGPKTDIEGIFHGVYYYYLLAAFYIIARGNPFVIAFIFTVINSLTVIIVYKICRLFFDSRLWGLAGATIAAFSFNLIIYSRWISNVSPAVPIFATFFYFVVKTVKFKTSRYLPAAVFFGFLLLHFEILSIFAIFTTIFLALILYRIRLNLRDSALCFFAILINIFPFALFEIKHNFLFLNGIRRHLSSGTTGEFSMAGNLKNYLSGIDKEVVSTVFSFAGSYPFLCLSLFVVFFFIILSVKSGKNEKKDAIFLFFSVFATFPLFIFLKYSSLEQFFVGASIPIIIFLVFFLRIIYIKIQPRLKPIFISFIIFIVLANVFYAEKSLRSRDNIFYYTTQKEVALGKKIKVIKYMQSFNEKYSFDAFTSPLYRPDGWNYLNEWLNRNNPSGVKNESKLFFLAIEPFTDTHWLKLWLEKYDKESVLENTVNIDGITLQKRKKI